MKRSLYPNNWPELAQACYDFRCSERRRSLVLEMLKHQLLLDRQQGGHGMIDVRRAYRSRFPLPIVQTALQWAAMCPLKSVHQHVLQKG